MNSERLYRLYKNDTDSKLFGEFTSFIDLWLSKFNDGSFPQWSDYQFEDFPDWYGRLSLAKINDTKELDIVLWGTQLVDWWGFDFTNKSIGFKKEAYPEAWNEAEKTYHDTLVETKSIGMWKGNLDWVGRGYINIRNIDLPLSQDGKISHILSAYIKFEPETYIEISAEPTHTFYFKE
ncbi:MAG: hypothetical protein HON65_00105 [Rhodospirillales bacterium]|jgi:hypothetical protein|nr:hypothetical protein [Rhodospirillales bacterium]